MSQFADNPLRTTPQGAVQRMPHGETRHSAGQAHHETHAAAVGEVDGRGLAPVKLRDQSHDVQAETEVGPAVGAGARLPQRLEQAPLKLRG